MTNPVNAGPAKERLTITPADRPEATEDENRVLARRALAALNQIADYLGMAGSPDLLVDVPEAVRRLVTNGGRDR